MYIGSKGCNMKKKKVISTLLMMIMVIGLTACGDSAGGDRVRKTGDAKESSSVSRSDNKTDSKDRSDNDDKGNNDAGASDSGNKDSDNKDSDAGNGGDDIKDRGAGWMAYYGMFIEIEEDRHSESEVLAEWFAGNVVPMRDLTVEYRSATGEYTMYVSVGNEQLWGVSKERPDGQTAIQGNWIDVSDGHIIRASPFYAKMSSDGGYIYLSYDEPNMSEPQAHPISGREGADLFIKLSE